MSTAGGRNRLEVAIRRKGFDIAEGGSIEVLRDLAFTLEPGTFTCMIGPSGCGKTTALRIILGLDDDYQGAIRLPDARREAGDADTDGGARIAAVFQEPRLLPWRTVEQNVRLALPPGSTPDLDALFATLGLEEMRDRYPSELSLGLARRAALARAFAVMPDILLLDEPFVSLDERTAERLRSLLETLWQTQRATVLMVTHNVREAVRLADRLLLVGGHPASVVGDVAVPLPRAGRGKWDASGFLDDLCETYPETVHI
ncbi:ABC transporter ATP-binding protein [Breoghania sp. L-A4]|nr:ABC transporter ATP-binding protein [Breoghania sp. L-A4]